MKTERDEQAGTDTTPALVYGGCGTEGCIECHPLFDADNNEIPCPEDCTCTGR